MKKAGSKKDRKPNPTAAPHTGAPTPHTCNAANPIAVATIPTIELLYVLARIIFSFTFLITQVIVNDNSIINKIPKIVYQP